MSLIEVETQWSLEDVEDAHAILDTYEELERRTERAMARAAKRRR